MSINLSVQAALGPTQSPVQWVPGIYPWGKCGRGVLLITHFLLVPRLRNVRGYTSSPSMRQHWHVTGNLYFFYPPIILMWELYMKCFFPPANGDLFLFVSEARAL
jgi:hypothetical protein